MAIDIDFGKKIKRLIESSGDTYIQAAERLGSTPSTVNRWTRQTDLDTSILKQVCMGYKITMSYFLSESASYSINTGEVNGGINAVGKKIMQSGNTSDTTNQDTKLLVEKLRSCEEKNALLERMVSILERK